jgi:hypothetical protein
MRLIHSARARLRVFARREEGTQMIELAIVLPVLLLLFAGATELGHMFHTYTTLSKATRSASRYLSTSKDIKSADTDTAAGAENAAKNLVLCGNAEGCGGDGQPAVIVHGLEADNITITKPAGGIGEVEYVTVEITGYAYTPFVFNLSAMTGGSFDFTLSPSTTMRYMP